MVRCIVGPRGLRWRDDARHLRIDAPPGKLIELPEASALYLAGLCLVALVPAPPMLAPRPPRPEPRLRKPFAWALADIEAAAAAAPKPAARAFWQVDEPKRQKRAQARPARQRPRRGGGASLPRWTATDAPPVR